jgi:hypothetical protein
MWGRNARVILVSPKNRMEYVFDMYFRFIFVCMNINLRIFSIHNFMRFASYHSFLPEKKIATAFKSQLFRKKRNISFSSSTDYLKGFPYYILDEFLSSIQPLLWNWNRRREIVKFQARECEARILEDMMHIIKDSMKCCRCSTASKHFGELITGFTAADQ